MKRKLGNLLLLCTTVCLVAVSATGCQINDVSDSKTTVTPAVDRKSGDNLTPITFSMYGATSNPNFENMESPIGKMITEKTGVKLKMEYAVGEEKQKISLMAASGDYPDLIFAHGNENILVDAGAYIDLTELIDKHAPNIKKLYGDYFKRLRWSTTDKSIYTLGALGVNEQKWEPATGFQLQHEVVKELGYPKLKTLQDFEKAIQTYKDKYPKIDGQPTIGLSVLADDWRYKISVTNPALFATGGPDDGEFYVNPDSKKTVYHYTRPEEKEYFRWLNHMNDVGLLDPESFVQKYDQYVAKISAGRVLGLSDAKWEYRNAEQALRQAGKLGRMYGTYPLTLNESYKYADFQTGGYSGGTGIGISKNCKDPVRAIKFLDWLASEEAQILNNWGIEGVNYKIENGKRVIPQEEMTKRLNDPQYSKKTGIGVYLYPFPEYGNGVLDSTGQTITIRSKDQIKASYTDIEKEVLSKYNASMWMDLYPPTSDFPVKQWGDAWQISIPQSPAYVISRKTEDIVKKRVPEAVLAKPEKFDQIWEVFMKDLETVGVHEMEEEFNKLLKDRIELWK
ncbi:ABC transporter substrate-binding protein [Paenibacillus qinlingensis]|uniref:ABC transporter substrate-binding protein n=1 Tax=Paenibacillus qinlingensis TaxID=1837343 RepID=UPI0015653B3C|nr:ABC transporter substrate-binding protein [Paenibacillus qinlingensis]NQX59976.1 extracellular solute-binding protein [Paenibacillus qinlingensis]